MLPLFSRVALPGSRQVLQTPVFGGGEAELMPQRGRM
eukprot:gene14627-14073_t